MDPYATLGVAREAETEVITAAYRALVKLYHPDGYPGDRQFATQRLQEINAAYDILSSEEKRNAYDAENAQQQSNDSAGQSSFENENEEFLKLIKEQWDYATQFHPELVELDGKLNRIDQSLAYAFMTYLVLSKSYSDARSAAKIFKEEYLYNKFGEQENVRELAYKAIMSGNRSFAVDLNEALARLGQGSTENALKRLATKYPEFAVQNYPIFGFEHCAKEVIRRREAERKAEEDRQRREAEREAAEKRQSEFREAERKAAEKRQSEIREAERKAAEQRQIEDREAEREFEKKIKRQEEKRKRRQGNFQLMNQVVAFLASAGAIVSWNYFFFVSDLMNPLESFVVSLIVAVIIWLTVKGLAR